jgi:hypothetical protein
MEGRARGLRDQKAASAAFLIIGFVSVVKESDAQAGI